MAYQCNGKSVSRIMAASIASSIASAVYQLSMYSKQQISSRHNHRRHHIIGGKRLWQSGSINEQRLASSALATAWHMRVAIISRAYRRKQHQHQSIGVAAASASWRHGNNVA